MDWQVIFSPRGQEDSKALGKESCSVGLRHSQTKRKEGIAAPVGEFYPGRKIGTTLGGKFSGYFTTESTGSTEKG